MGAEPGAGAAAYAATLAQEFEAALLDIVEDLEPHRDQIEYAVRTGHRTRPVGCLLACAAVGGDWREALGAAVGIEFLHKSSVIRDDIADGDAVRSGQPSLHAVYGIPTALGISDWLWTTGFLQFGVNAPPALSTECLRAATDVVREMAVGQLEDIDPTKQRRSPEDRIEVEEQKTGSLAGLACHIGAVIGGGHPSEVSALRSFGRKLGTAFQVLNDMRNLSGEEAGRRAASDLRQRRVTVLSAYAQKIGTGAGLPNLGEVSDAKVEQARRDLLASGVLQFGEELAAQLLDEARAQLGVLPATEACEVLGSLTSGVLRDHAF
ncbi:MAG: polyprenyl synthetase family protein [Solirubrobacterales bacterium]